MKATGFWYHALATIELTGTEVQALMDLSAMHYDAVCKRAGQHGGFIYGWNNQIIVQTQPKYADNPVSEADAKIEVTIREYDLQTLCKILEQPGSPPEFQRFFWERLKGVHAEMQRLNGTPQPL